MPSRTASRESSPGAAFAWRASYLGGAKLISLVRFLVLAMLLDPADFGLLAIGVVALEILVALTDLGMQPALIQRQRPTEHEYEVAWTVDVLRTLAVVAVVMAAAPSIAGLFGEPRATNVLRGLALGTLIAGFGSVRVADLHRKLDFRGLAWLGLSTALIEATVSIALAPLLGVWALVAGTVAAATAGTAISFIVAPFVPRIRLDFAAARPLLTFGRWVFVTTIVFAAGDAVLRGVISRQLGVADLGLYYLAFRLAALPQTAVSELIAPVTFPLYARMQDSLDRVGDLYRKSVVALAGLLLPTYLLLIALAPLLISDVLGERWAGAVPVVQVLALAGLAGVVAESAVPLVSGLGRPYFATLIFATRSIVVIALVWFLAGAFGLVGAAVAWVLSTLAVQLVAIVAVERTLPSPFVGLGRPLAAIAISSGAGGAIAWWTAVRLSGLLGLIGAALLAGGVILLLMVAFDRLWRLELRATLLRLLPSPGRPQQPPADHLVARTDLDPPGAG